MGLDDAAANALPVTGALSGGTFRPTAEDIPASYTFPLPAPSGPYALPAPEATATFANTFNGAAPTGTWKLFVKSRGAGTAGTRQISGGWCLTFLTSGDPATVTTLSVNPSPSAVGAVAAITGAVTVAANGTPVTAGTLTFKDGSSVLQSGVALNGSGTASINTSSLTQGAHFLSAEYSGAPGFNVSIGNALHFVDGPTTQTSLQFCNNSIMPIPDLVNAPSSVYPSRILVSGLPGTVNNVTMTLKNVTLAAGNALDALLTGPNGGAFIPFSDGAGSGAFTNQTFTLSDSAANQLPSGAAIGGTYRPTNHAGADTFPAPAPSIGVLSAAPTGAGTFASLFANSNPNGFWALHAVSDTGTGTNPPNQAINGWCLDFSLNPPDLSITKTHAGNFRQGQTGAQYSVVVRNNGPGSTGGTVTVVDTPPAGLTITGLSGPNWNCTVATATCTTTQIVAANTDFPAITVTVDVAANAPASLTNSATVSGGGDASTGNNTASDLTTILQNPDLTVSKTSTGAFAEGGMGSFSIVVTNSGGGPTSGSVTVQDPMPAGLTISQVNGGPDWSCLLSTATTVSCTISTVLQGGASYPAITVPVTIAEDTAASVMNTATVSGGGDSNTTNNTGSVTVPIIQKQPVAITVPAGVSFSFNGVSFTGSQTIQILPGNYVLSTTTPQTLAAGTRAVFGTWSDGGAIAHIVTVGSSPVSISGNFTTQHQLTLAASPSIGGNVTPASGTFFDAGTVVNVTATANSGFTFANWTGPVANANAAVTTVTMSAPQSLTANFGVAAAPEVTGQLTIVRGALVLNRATGRFQQVVNVTNNGGALSAAAYVLDSLAPGVSLVNPSGTTSAAAPAGSPYRELGALAAGGSVSTTLEFTRTGPVAVTYSPRVLGGGAR
ncbi:MAG: Ig-like domain repeat protein [Acidobacteria bacterium]|nr:Ig-like domain repeat protein [Acidobacteriota bacterium]